MGDTTDDESDASGTADGPDADGGPSGGTDAPEGEAAEAARSGREPTGAGESDGPVSGAEEAVGDGRQKYVEVVTDDGERREHGDAYVREDEETFYVSADEAFPPAETSVYRKRDLARVSIEQHHSACFVTTAVAGDEETLAALRGFRDGALRPSPVGGPLVSAYEAVSPPIADTLAARPDGRTARVVRRLVRGCAALARRRERASPIAGTALSTLLTALYVVGVAIAAAGHLVTRAGERFGS